MGGNGSGGSPMRSPSDRAAASGEVTEGYFPFIPPNTSSDMHADEEGKEGSGSAGTYPSPPPERASSNGQVTPGGSASGPYRSAMDQKALGAFRVTL